MTVEQAIQRGDPDKYETPQNFAGTATKAVAVKANLPAETKAEIYADRGLNPKGDSVPVSEKYASGSK